ncbi:hypothetical protein CBR_g11969 [Chara braunii]|uniref:CCHC-type domain-containing protein n=1 Tax=Chara braunii TaxID=69332 RepID=A0A388KQP1_CHABU|nr:hypothetical protein CBR_g11969 [Chara braunii]|eukprot:GBG72391.1 hypothetical protein CBR_g11969 [Chara braunii]
MPEAVVGGSGKALTLDDLIEALDRRERVSSNVPKVDTFHFNGERVSDWLDLVEQALVGLFDEVKFQRILKYVLHGHHQEVGKVMEAANGSWARFKDGMERKYRLGNGLLTTADLEAMNRDDFTTVGAFVQEFKKKARKVPGISEEAQCAIFFGLLTSSETSELTSHGGGSAKLTWATIDKGVEEGSLDQVEQHQMRLQRRKRKERDATASETPGVRRIVTDVLAELGYGKDVAIQKKVVTAVQGKGKDQVLEEVVQEEWEEEEWVPQHLSKALRKQRNLTQGGQGSGKGQAPQAVVVASPNASAPSSSPESMPGRQGYPGVTTVSSGPRSRMTHRPPTPLAAQTRGQAKARASQDPPQREPEPERRKEPVEVEDDDDGDQEDERLRQEEDRRAEQRARKRGSQQEPEPVLRDTTPKTKKYAVRLEKGFDVERVIDRLLEGHNDLMTLKEILASAPRLRNELKGGPLQSLEAHLDASQWEVPQSSGGQEAEPLAQREQQTKEVIVIGEDTPPQQPTLTPEVEAEPTDVREEGGEPQRGETPPLPPDTIQSPEVRAETELEETDWRKEVVSMVDRYLTAHAAEHPDLEEVPGGKPLQEPHPPPTEATEAPPDDIHPIAGRARPRETDKEKRIRVGKRLEEIWQERQRLEAAGELPCQPPSAPAKAPRIPYMRKEFFEQRTEGLASPTRAGFTVARQVEETLDKSIQFLARTSFDRYLMLEGDLAGKKAKEEGHGVRLEALEAEVQDLRALATSQAAIIQSLLEERKKEGASTKVVDQTEGARYDIQGQAAQGFGQPSEAGPSQGPPLGRVILGPEEAKAKREAEKEAFVFRAPTEFATLPVEPLGVPPASSPLPGEEGPQGVTSESAQESMEGPMGVLLEALDTMQEEASTPMPELSTETVGEGLPMVVSEERRESRPQRLDTPEYVPEVGDLRSRLGSWATGSGSGERAPESEQQEVASTTMGSPSSPPPQPRKKKFKRKVDQLCFFCKKGVHWALECPKFLKDKAEGRVSESAGKMYDRQGRVVERSANGGRAQLYR